MSWKKTLNKIVQSPKLHGRFLNTISLLEYIGARKIIKSQREEEISRETLAHMSEEIRHAQIFKKLALKVDSRLTTYDDQHLLAGGTARTYLQTIDRGVEALLGNGCARSNYWVSTLIIEERANSIYPYYAELLEPFGYAGPIRGILREEESHLEQIEAVIDKDNVLSTNQLKALRRIEKESFTGLIGAMDNAALRLDSFSSSAHII